MKKVTPAATAADPAADPERPTRGGSFVRNADGSLTVVEETLNVAPENAAPTVDAPPAGASIEGENDGE